MSICEITCANSSKVSVVSPSFSPTRVLLWLIRTYQSLRVGRISPCRFVPSCSEYASEAIEQHGAWRGSLLALRRISKCRPLGPHGIDLVPVASTSRRTNR